MEEGDYFDVKDIDFETFIKLHQVIEDSGKKLSYSTKTRSSLVNFKYEALACIDGCVQGCSLKNSDLRNRLNISDFINYQENYEIY